MPEKREETYLRGMALELCPLRLPRSLGLGELLLKFSQTPTLVPEQPAQFLQCDLHVGQGLDVLVRLQIEQGLVKNSVKAGRAALLLLTQPAVQLGPSWSQRGRRPVLEQPS